MKNQGIDGLVSELEAKYREDVARANQFMREALDTYAELAKERERTLARLNEARRIQRSEGKARFAE